MPILHSSGVSTPGQFGPISRDLLPDSARFTLHHVEHRNALGDAHDQRNFGIDRLEDRVGGKGRRHVDDAGIRAGRLLSASSTVSNIGRPICVVPPLPGVTPPTICVP